MTDGIRQMLEEMLAADDDGRAVLTSGLGPKKITAIDFTITSPAVRIGSASGFWGFAGHAGRANTLVAGQTETRSIRTPPSVFSTPSRISTRIRVPSSRRNSDRPLYHLHAQSSDQAIAIPFAVAITEGGVHKLGSSAIRRMQSSPALKLKGFV